MRLPEDERQREDKIREVLGQCLGTIGARRARYHELRKWVLYGSTGSMAARFNKIFPTLDQLTAFTFAAESTRFAIELSEDEDNEAKSTQGDEPERCDILSQAIREAWHDGHGDSTFMEAVFWSYAFGCTITKQLWIDGQKRYYFVEPGSFGVLREDINSLDDQEAMVHPYCIGRDQLRRLLVAKGTSEEAITAFMLQVPTVGGDKATPEEENFVGRLVVSQATPTMVGAVMDLQNWSSNLSPEVKEDLVEMNELWLWDDGIDEYRCITLAGSQNIIFDRPGSSMVPKGESPFTKVCPSPVYNYFWGRSECEALIPLQTWREDRMRQIDGLWQRQMKPPVVMTGFMGITDEKVAALWRPGGQLGEQNPNAKATPITPQFPPDVFQEIHEIDQMFEYTVGLPPITQGRGEPGVRAGDQADSMAKMPAARMRKRALQIESALERIGTLTFKFLQRESRRVYHTEAGMPFVAGQFPADYSVTVAAHTSSPLFAGELKQDAETLFKLGLIDGGTMLEMMDPPMLQMLQSRLKQKQLAEQKENEQEKQMLLEALQHLAPPEKAGFLVKLMTAIKPGKK